MALRKFAPRVVGGGTAAIDLYRKICRDVPTILTIYDLDVSVKEAREKVKSKFKENAHVKDASIIEIMLHHAQVEYDEARLQWKTPAQLMAFFERADYSDKQIDYMNIAKKDPIKAFELGLDG